MLCASLTLCHIVGIVPLVLITQPHMLDAVLHQYLSLSHCIMKDASIYVLSHPSIVRHSVEPVMLSIINSALMSRLVYLIFFP